MKNILLCIAAFLLMTSFSFGQHPAHRPNYYHYGQYFQNYHGYYQFPPVYVSPYNFYGYPPAYNPMPSYYNPHGITGYYHFNGNGMMIRVW